MGVARARVKRKKKKGAATAVDDDRSWLPPEDGVGADKGARAPHTSAAVHEEGHLLEKKRKAGMCG